MPSAVLLFGGLPAGTHGHQGDEQENAPGGQDDVQRAAACHTKQPSFGIQHRVHPFEGVMCVCLTCVCVCVWDSAQAASIPLCMYASLCVCVCVCVHACVCV